jgi:hypothetical protein
MATDPLIAIHAELAQIKLAIIVLGSLVALAAIFTIVRGYFHVKGVFRGIVDDQFAREASRLLDRNKLSELKNLCSDMLADRPNHAHARWYLGRALLLDGELEASLREFEALRHICPSWKSEYIEPNIQEIDRLRAARSEPR